MSRLCAGCGTTLNVANTGRPKKYCSATCRKRGQRSRERVGCPDEMVRLDRWVGWKPIRRGGRWTKLPVRVDGRPASTTSPDSWGSYHVTRLVHDRVGFVLGGGIGGIDLDGCVSESGELNWQAREILRRTGPTWVELSPSGRGLHIWGLLDEGPGRVVDFEGQSVEVYSTGRYFTVTGLPFEGAPLVLADLGGVVSSLI